MRFTPMADEKVNEISFRDYIYEKRYIVSFFKGHSLDVAFLPYITSPKGAKLAEATQKIHDLDIFLERIREIERE